MSHSNQNIKMRNKWFYLVQLIADIAIIYFSYAIAMKYYGGAYYTQIFTAFNYRTIFFTIAPLFVFMIVKSYYAGQDNYRDSIINIFVSMVFVSFSLVVLDFIFKNLGIWRSVVFYAFLMQSFMFLLSKYLFVKIYNRIDTPIKSVIICKEYKTAMVLVKKLMISIGKTYDIEKIILSSCDDIKSHIVNIDMIFVCDDCDPYTLSKLCEYGNNDGIDLCILPKLEHIVVNSSELYIIDDTPTFLNHQKFDVETRFLKRSVDIIISSIALVIASPFLLLSMLFIFIQDGGSPIFKQTRVTRGNKEFNLYKLRSMIINAEKKTGAVLAVSDDHRVTKLGKLLRASRLDEVPQLVNVFKGDMSLIGPRPERPELIPDIVKEVPVFAYRTAVRAGLTGLAQMRGKYDTDFKDKVMMDLYYINNYSLWLDFTIMINTMTTLLKPSVSKGVSDKEDRDIFYVFYNKGYSVKKNDSWVDVYKEKK